MEDCERLLKPRGTNSRTSSKKLVTVSGWSWVDKSGKTELRALFEVMRIKSRCSEAFDQVGVAAFETSRTSKYDSNAQEATKCQSLRGSPEEGEVSSWLGTLNLALIDLYALDCQSFNGSHAAC